METALLTWAGWTRAHVPLLYFRLQPIRAGKAVVYSSSQASSGSAWLCSLAGDAGPRLESRRRRLGRCSSARPRVGSKQVRSKLVGSKRSGVSGSGLSRSGLSGDMRDVVVSGPAGTPQDQNQELQSPVAARGAPVTSGLSPQGSSWVGFRKPRRRSWTGWSLWVLVGDVWCS